MCPGTGHRICNDCMKACIYQKQEPVNIPQIETGVLTDVLDLPWGFEIYGLLTRWNPLNIQRPVRAALQRQERAGRRPRPGRLHAGALPAERRLRRRRRSTASRSSRCPTSSTGARRPAAAADPRLERDLPPARRARARRLRRRLRVRHHRSLGQELPHADPPDAGAPRQAAHLRRRALRRHAADRGRVGAAASITSRSPPAPAGRRSSTSRTT